MSLVVEIAFVIIVALLLAISATLDVAHGIAREVPRPVYCTNGFRPIVYGGDTIGCQRNGWQS